MRVPARDAPQPVGGGALSTTKPLVLPTYPRHEGALQVTEDLNALRAVEPAVVVHPPPDHGVAKPRDVFQALVVPGRCHPPSSNGVAHGLRGRGADRGEEAHEVLPRAVLRASR